MVNHSLAKYTSWAHMYYWILSMTLWLTDRQFPFYRQEHGGPEGIRNLLKVTTLEKKQTQDMKLVCLTERVWFSSLVLFVTDTPHCLPLGDETVCVRAQSLSCVWPFWTPRTVVHQALLSVGFPRQEYWSGLPFPTPGDLPNTGIEPTSLAFLALAGRLFSTMPPGKPGWSDYTGQLESPQIKKKKKEYMDAICSNMDGPRGYHSKSNKSDQERNSHMILLMCEILKSDTNEFTKLM